MSLLMSFSFLLIRVEIVWSSSSEREGEGFLPNDGSILFNENILRRMMNVFVYSNSNNFTYMTRFSLSLSLSWGCHGISKINDNGQGASACLQYFPYFSSSTLSLFLFRASACTISSSFS
jgi:hypothetical protein